MLQTANFNDSIRIPDMCQHPFRRLHLGTDSLEHVPEPDAAEQIHGEFLLLSTSSFTGPVIRYIPRY